MYHVLLPVDSNEQRAEQMADTVVDAFGDRDDLEVVVLNVYEAFDVTDEGGHARSADLYDEDDFPTSVELATGRLADAGLDATRRREHGDPTDEILAVADEIDADCIAISGRKRTPAGKALFGSVTQSVLLGTDRPVLVTTKESSRL